MRRSKDYLQWRANVLNRDDNQCVICGHDKKFLNAHHLIPKNFDEFALLIDNGISLCPGCHTLGKFSAHKNPIWFVEWMKINRPMALQRSIERLEALKC